MTMSGRGYQGRGRDGAYRSDYGFHSSQYGRGVNSGRGGWNNGYTTSRPSYMHHGIYNYGNNDYQAPPPPPSVDSYQRAPTYPFSRSEVNVLKQLGAKLIKEEEARKQEAATADPTIKSLKDEVGHLRKVLADMVAERRPAKVLVDDDKVKDNVNWQQKFEALEQKITEQAAKTRAKRQAKRQRKVAKSKSESTDSVADTPSGSTTPPASQKKKTNVQSTLTTEEAQLLEGTLQRGRHNAAIKCKNDAKRSGSAPATARNKNNLPEQLRSALEQLESLSATNISKVIRDFSEGDERKLAQLFQKLLPDKEYTSKAEAIKLLADWIRQKAIIISSI